MTPRVDQREAKQQARIAGAEANAKADGVVTAKSRRHLTRMQNHASKNIYAQKHDAQVAKP